MKRSFLSLFFTILFSLLLGSNVTRVQAVFDRALLPSEEAVRTSLVPDEGIIVGSVQTPGDAKDVFVSGKYAYVAADNSGLQVIDVSDPENPAIAASLGMQYAGRARRVTVIGSYAYVANDLGTFNDPVFSLEVIDISEPLNPKSVGYYGATGGPPQDLYIGGSNAYVVEQSSYLSPPGGLNVINISNPQDPSTGSLTSTGMGALGVSVYGDYAYVADGGWEGVLVFDVSDPENVTELGSVSAPYASKVRTGGTYAYVAGVADLQVFDLQDPETPVLVGGANRPFGAESLFLTGDAAYIAADENGIQVLDIRDPHNPFLVASGDTPGRAKGVYAVDSYVYVADNEAGLAILRFAEQDQPLVYLPLVIR